MSGANCILSMRQYREEMRIEAVEGIWGEES